MTIDCHPHDKPVVLPARCGRARASLASRPPAGISPLRKLFSLDCAAWPSWAELERESSLLPITRDAGAVQRHGRRNAGTATARPSLADALRSLVREPVVPGQR